MAFPRFAHGRRTLVAAKAGVGDWLPCHYCAPGNIDTVIYPGIRPGDIRGYIVKLALGDRADG
jgi:hypothetical protein